MYIHMYVCVYIYIYIALSLPLVNNPPMNLPPLRRSGVCEWGEQFFRSVFFFYRRAKDCHKSGFGAEASELCVEAILSIITTIAIL